MKNVVIIGIILSIVSCAYAVTPYNSSNVPQGTFKKQRNGTYINYDKKGKKIGIYKISGGKLTRIK